MTRCPKPSVAPRWRLCWSAFLSNTGPTWTGRSMPDDDLLAADETMFRTNAWCSEAASSKRGAGFDQWGMKNTAQGGPTVLRYRSDLDTGLMRRYAADGTPSDPGLAGVRGVGPVAVPWYLLIIGSPEEIPWRFQYRLQLDAYV